MDVKTIIGLAASGLFLMKKQTSTLENKIKNLENNYKTDVTDLENQIKNTDTSSSDYIKKYIKVTPFLQFTEVSGSLWKGRFTWEIKNTSSDKTFNIVGVKAVFNLCGYTCSLFMPGNRDQFVTLSPGTSVKLNSTWQDKRWFDDSNARSVIRDSLRADIGKSVGGKLKANISMKFQTSLAGGGEPIITWENVPGYVWLTSGAIHYYNKQGENMVDKSL